MKFIAVMCLGLFVSAPSAMADITLFPRDNFDRLTIEPVRANDLVMTDSGGVSIPYTIAPSPDLLNSRTIVTADIIDNRLVLSFNDAVTDTRHFRIGNRVVLDVFFDPEQLTNKPAVAVIADENVVPSDVTEPEPESVIAVKKQSAPIEVAEDAPVFNNAQDGLAQATLVTISSTSNFSLAVFERFGRLFIVTDQPDMTIPPQISGNGSQLGWNMTTVEIDGGSAWVIPLPDNAFIRPEGGGLIWRVVVSDTNPDLKTSDIRRRTADPNDPKIDILMENASKLMRLTDPDYGDDLAIVTASRSSSRMNIDYDFVDFDIIPAIIGAVIKPESDGLRIAAGQQFITITKAGGLTVSTDSQSEIIRSYLDGEAGKLAESTANKTALDRVFYFTDWGAGTKPHDYTAKRKELDLFLVMAEKDTKLSILLNLVKLTLSQGMGQEALGYLDIANDFNPQIHKTPEYISLRGAAHYLANQYDLAKAFFSAPELEMISEARLWRAASLAAMGDDEQAVEAYIDNAVLASVYPYELKREVIAPLARAMLDEDRGADALPLIQLLDQDMTNQSAEARATLAYLKGRAQSVTGRPDEGISNLYDASLSDKLGPYGIRSELLLVQDELDREVIDFKEAATRMERLRFAWRGDSLETEIQMALGRLYITHGEPRKGLNILKRAAKNTESIQERRQTVRIMADAYQTIFSSDDFANMDPMVAIAVYDEFKELTPVGDEGNQLIDKIADKLMSINLLSRATDILTDKMNRLGAGQHAIKTGLRIAAIQLIDRNPNGAFDVLSKVDTMMSAYSGDDKDDLNSKIVLLKARAYSDIGEPETALFMTEGLDDTDDVIRLRVDTAWRSNRWVAVTDNLGKLLARENIMATTPPTAQQTQLILNQAVALSLSDQYDALQRFASQYDLVMKQSPSYKTFLLVSRPQNISNLADRQTLLGVTAEVDLFKNFLDAELK